MFEDKSAKILVVDDEASIRQTLKGALEDEGYQVLLAENGSVALDMIQRESPHLVMLDIWMPGPYDGLKTLSVAMEGGLSVPVVMMSGHGTIETAVKATKLGAWDFLEKPLSIDKVVITIQNALAFQAERQDKMSLLHRLRKNLSIVGEHPRIQEVKKSISRRSSSQDWALLMGPPGTGKRLIAENIHYSSPRAARPFVVVHCQGLPRELLEIEFFGAPQDTLPGVQAVKRGKLELAKGGTLYLDEVTELPLAIQDALVEGVRPSVERKPSYPWAQASDVRILASTTKSWSEVEREGLLSPRMKDELNSWTLEVPELNERASDLPALLQHFSDDIAHRGGYPIKQITEPALRVLRAYGWPGQIRELRNFVERLYILCPHQEIHEHDVHYCGLVSELVGDNAGRETNWVEFSNFREARAEFEKEYLSKKIADNKGNISKTAEEIGLERSYLHRKIKAYNIEV